MNDVTGERSSLLSAAAFAWRWCAQSARSWWFCERHGVPHEWCIAPHADSVYCETCHLGGELVDD